MTGSSFEVLTGLESSYDQIQKLAIGGMAEVFLGRQKTLDRPVAIKRIRPELRANPDIRERFRREARLSANLLHQNLAHVYDYRELGEDSYIVMEFIDGFDLAEIVDRVGALPFDVALMIGIRILQGLSYVHSHGMVHRDLKPDNVRITSRGEVKIMDFGIAFDPAESNLTMPGVLIGSPHYLSPEQVGGDRVDGRADLFAFGITFYEILTAKRPFFETNTESVYSRIKRGDYIPPENIREGLPNFFTKIIESCLKVNPLRRPASAYELATTLWEYLDQNHATALEQRLRQFLMESKLVTGDPSRMEVNEQTAEKWPRVQIMARFGSEIDEILGEILVFFARPRRAIAWILGCSVVIYLVYAFLTGKSLGS